MNGMSPIEVESLANTAQAMSEGQWKIMLEYAPIELMCNEILRRNQIFNEKMAVINSLATPKN